MARGLLVIKILTPTHPGAGTSVGAIDLMLQREVTTDFPFIQGSSLKGAIRGYLETQPVEDKELANELINFVKQHGDEELKRKAEELDSGNMKVYQAREFVQKVEREKKEEVKKFKRLYEKLDKVFGPYESGREFKRSALIISDASLLFYPVRSLKGLYALVTCPEILRRLKMSHIGFEIPDSLLDLNDKDKVKALDTAKSNYAINGRVYFEDMNFQVTDLGQNELDWLKNLGFVGKIDDKNSDFYKIASRLFIVHDDVFQYFVKFATMVMSRNRISYTTGVVERGALWTEEHLPPETYLFSYLEDDGNPVDGSQTAFNWLKNQFNSSKVIHLGGDETVGKGFVDLSFTDLNPNPNGQSSGG